MQPVHLLRPVLDLLFAVPRQVPQVPDRRGGDQAGAQQAAFEQLRQPLAVLHIRLAPGDLFEVLHIDQQHREAVFQQIVERLPIDARALHGDMRNPERLQPIAQRQQIDRHRAKRVRLDPSPPVPVGHADRRHHRRLMNVYACAPINHAVHSVSSCWAVRRSGDSKNLLGVLTGNNSGCLRAPASHSVTD